MAENSSVPSTTQQQKLIVAPRWTDFKASFAPPTSMRQRLSSAAPPTAILIEEPHASVATPPSIVIGEPLISAAPPPLGVIEEPHSHVASPPAVGISEPFVSAIPPPTLRAIESHLRLPQPIDDK